MAHQLKYGASSHASLVRANPQHEFAHAHAVHLFDTNSVYSMIPKNGCTSLQLSIALQNGAISDASQWGWVRENFDTFRPSLRELVMARYRFTVLRCPYSRIISCFIDKILPRLQDALQFHAVAGLSVGLERLTFRRFCMELLKPSVRIQNPHWRPQVDFLVYDSYDDIFCFEAFDDIGPVLKKRAGLTLVDARPLVEPQGEQRKSLPAVKPFADTELWQIEQIVMSGLKPDPRSFVDDDIKALITRAYAPDFRLYQQHFPGMGLFEPPARPRAAVAGP